MAAGSAIEWTDATWNPVAGCTVITAGCSNCYAMRMAGRLELMGQTKYAGTTRKSGRRRVWTGQINLDRRALQAPFAWRTGRRVFVNSMSDLFHEGVPDAFVAEVFEVIERTPQHTYQLLTKRPDRALGLVHALPWPRNLWFGVSVEDEDVLWRVEALRQVPAFVRFLSCEPLLGPLDSLSLEGVDWLIAGGESGPGARPIDQTWVRQLRDACVVTRTAFHFKQWGGPVKSRTGRVLDGRTWDEFPAVARGASPCVTSTRARARPIPTSPT
jgi:protein gp37